MVFFGYNSSLDINSSVNESKMSVTFCGLNRDS